MYPSFNEERALRDGRVIEALDLYGLIEELENGRVSDRGS